MQSRSQLADKFLPKNSSAEMIELNKLKTEFKIHNRVCILV